MRHLPAAALLVILAGCARPVREEATGPVKERLASRRFVDREASLSFPGPRSDAGSLDRFASEALLAWSFLRCPECRGSGVGPPEYPATAGPIFQLHDVICRACRGLGGVSATCRRTPSAESSFRYANYGPIWRAGLDDGVLRWEEGWGGRPRR